MTLPHYKKAIGRLLKWVIVGLPFLSGIIGRHSPIPFPPLGPNLTMWQFLAALVIAVIALLPHPLRVGWNPANREHGVGASFHLVDLPLLVSRIQVCGQRRLQ